MVQDKLVGSPETRSELSDQLEIVLRTAPENGVDVRGGWPVENDATETDWEVHVTDVLTASSE
ncbi:MAG: hypothetical protein ABEJ42_04125 [Halobacteriaceae archaeon]